MTHLTIETTLDQIAHLTADDKIAARTLARIDFTSLDDAENKLRAFLSGTWLVYRGGRHVAVHRASGDDRRVLLVAEKAVRQ